MAHRLNTNKQFMVGNGILAFAVIFVVVIFVYMSMRLQQQKAENRNFIETYTITLTKGFAGDSTSIFINDSLLVNRTMTEEPFILEVKRFAEQSALMIVNNATEKLSLFELSEKGGEYRFEKEGEEVKQLAQEQKSSARSVVRRYQLSFYFFLHQYKANHHGLLYYTVP